MTTFLAPATPTILMKINTIRQTRSPLDFLDITGITRNRACCTYRKPSQRSSRSPEAIHHIPYDQHTILPSHSIDNTLSLHHHHINQPTPTKQLSSTLSLPQTSPNITRPNQNSLQEPSALPNILNYESLQPFLPCAYPALSLHTKPKRLISPKYHNGCSLTEHTYQSLKLGWISPTCKFDCLMKVPYSFCPLLLIHSVISEKGGK